LRAVAERMPELVLLLVGEWHEDECAKDPDFGWCRSAPNLVWLGRRSDDEAARLILCADVGILPFRVEPFNDAALPYRILKYARLGRRTISSELAGVHTWDRAVTTAADPDAFIAALRARAGARTRPDADLRAWALEQTAELVNEPLWERLRELGVT
jgi:glycosyltransferase involved in cell wall biosynthesis